MQTSKYLLASHRDVQWGLTVTTIGYEEIGPQDEYPTRGHADGYYFDLSKGRTLSEYQLLYITEGEGEFQSASTEKTTVKAGDFFLLFPGEWHTYHPKGRQGWKSYWIGFKGQNMDSRVRAGFLTPSKPIYHVGYSAEVISLYKQAYAAAQEEAAYAQQLMRCHPDIKLTEVYLKSGFANEISFFRTFKGITGMTPSEWKAKELANEKGDAI
jgi:hypothetical protein